jgi:hypothetical protein
MTTTQRRLAAVMAAFDGSSPVFYQLSVDTPPPSHTVEEFKRFILLWKQTANRNHRKTAPSSKENDKLLAFCTHNQSISHILELLAPSGRVRTFRYSLPY